MNDAKSKVSVVIPAMGFAQSVDVLLDALVNQEHLPDEVIIVDSSNDNSVSEIANNFRKKFFGRGASTIWIKKNLIKKEKICSVI